MTTKRTTFLMLVLASGALAFAGLTGCSKKPASTDVTRETPTDDGSKAGGGGGGGQDGQSSTNPSGSDEDRILKDVFFAYDDHSLSDDARTILSSNAGALREMTHLRVLIEGHCDERGTVEYNLALGQRRAEAARNYLVDLGIEGGRLSTISYGEERPFEDGHDETAWAQNRRAHFRVTNP